MYIQEERIRLRAIIRNNAQQQAAAALRKHREQVRLRREAADAEREQRLLSRAASHAGNTVPRRRSEEVYRTSERDGTCTSPLFSALLFSALLCSSLLSSSLFSSLLLLYYIFSSYITLSRLVLPLTLAVRGCVLHIPVCSCGSAA
eukprot:COSAG06_NODE_9338_length_1926_cov_112.147236_1_plen_145_part_10